MSTDEADLKNYDIPSTFYGKKERRKNYKRRQYMYYSIRFNLVFILYFFIQIKFSVLPLINELFYLICVITKLRNSDKYKKFSHNVINNMKYKIKFRMITNMKRKKYYVM